ncbi:MAG: hypothetical protein HYX92_03160 [Chloroflexi bacterium]|nr:hypothetical protein [Chloroflexota bacterium]
MLEFFDPTEGPSKEEAKLAKRPATLDGLTLGVIWNGRPVGDAILKRVIQSLRSRYRIEDVLFRRKTFVGNMSPPEIMDELATKCQVIIIGVGD